MPIFAGLVHAAFKSSKIIEMLIFVTTHKTTEFYSEVLTAKYMMAYSSFNTT